MAKKKDPRDVLLDEAHAILREQQRVLAQASQVARNAGHELGRFAQEDVAPRLAATGRRSWGQARHVIDDVLPAVGAAVGSALNLLEGKGSTLANSVSKKYFSRDVAPTKSGPGVGTYVAIGIGVAALIGIGYVAYQTFRADDELWVAEDDDL